MFQFRPFGARVLVGAVAALMCTAVTAQVRPPTPRPSQKASVMQTLGTTEISITYSRPAVKGRAIFGDWPSEVKGEATLDDGRSRPAGAPLVPFGHIWRAGANEATLFVAADDVIVNGQPLAAGRYSFHAIPAKDGEWTLIFNTDEGQWGSFSYDAKKDALRIKAKAQNAAESQELLAFEITPDAPGNDNAATTKATVALRWEKLRVPFTVEVKDTVGATMKRLRAFVAEAKPEEWQRANQAATYAKQNKLTEDAAKWYDQAVKAIDLQIAAKPTFANYRQKSVILTAAGRTAEAIAAAEKAVAAGKADPAVKPEDITALEKRIADMKAARN